MAERRYRDRGKQAARAVAAAKSVNEMEVTDNPKNGDGK